MTTTNLVAYDPNNAEQQSFLQSLALGETGNAADASVEGVGGTNLSTDTSTDEYGFPQWTGDGNSHAAGTYQFEPGTWDQVASTYDLNFSNPSDQSAGAWYYAEQTYAAKTGGSLSDALSSGNYSSIQSALSGVWPSVTGNQAAPQGLAADLASGTGATGATATTSASGSTPAGTSASGTSAAASTSLWSNIATYFQRFGLIIIGGIIIIAALWALLADKGVVPGPTKLAKGLAL